MADIRDVIAAMEPSVRKAFNEAIADIRSEARIATLVRALEEGRVEDAIRALHLDDAFFAPLDDALTAARIAGGRDALAGLPMIPDPFRESVWSSALMAETRELRLNRGTQQGG